MEQQGFNFQIGYVPGEDNEVADLLSRDGPAIETVEALKSLDEAVLEKRMVHLPSLEELAEATRVEPPPTEMPSREGEGGVRIIETPDGREVL